jgi:hypothetical protein
VLEVTFTQAARAAGITEKQLRNWLDKQQVRLEADQGRGERKWRRFQLLDVLRLAVVGSIVRYGISVGSAVEMVRSIDTKLRALSAEVHAGFRKRFPPTAGVSIVISRGGSAEDADYLAPGAEFLGPLMCSYTHNRKQKPETRDLRHFIFIDVGAITKDVLSRLDDESDLPNR